MVKLRLFFSHVGHELNWIDLPFLFLSYPLHFCVHAKIVQPGHWTKHPHHSLNGVEHLFHQERASKMVSADQKGGKECRIGFFHIKYPITTKISSFLHVCWPVLSDIADKQRPESIPHSQIYQNSDIEFRKSWRTPLEMGASARSR